MRFSQRIGTKSVSKELQLGFMDEELKTTLWNVILLNIIDEVPKYYRYVMSDYFRQFSNLVWHEFLKLPIDRIGDNPQIVVETIRSKYFQFKWDEVYDFVEYLVQMKLEQVDFSKAAIAINRVLEIEFSAYRLIDKQIVPISNKLEVEEIENALAHGIVFTSLRGVNIHLNNALEKLSDKKNPDYRNSIKESISAVEAMCRVITGESTLGSALKVIEFKGVKFDEQFKVGIEKLYHYTNNKEGGMRHAIIGEHKNPDFDDAKYMLVLCSSFINFLVGKCKTYNIPIS